jgi:hypothetical protein
MVKQATVEKPVKGFPKTRAALEEAAKENARNMAKGKEPAVDDGLKDKEKPATRGSQ